MVTSGSLVEVRQRIRLALWIAWRVARYGPVHLSVGDDIEGSSEFVGVGYGARAAKQPVVPFRPRAPWDR